MLVDATAIMIGAATALGIYVVSVLEAPEVVHLLKRNGTDIGF